MSEEQQPPSGIHRLPNELHLRSRGLVRPNSDLIIPAKPEGKVGFDETEFEEVGGLLRPKQKNTDLHAAEADQILQLAAAQAKEAEVAETEKYPPLTTREVTLLLSNPRALLQQNFLQTCGVEKVADLTPELREVVLILQKYSFTRIYDNREEAYETEEVDLRESEYPHLIHRKPLRDVAPGEYSPTEAGPAEKLCLEFLRYLSHPEVRRDALPVQQELAVILRNVLSELRGFPHVMRELPEMPELLMGLLRSAELSANQPLRFQIYDCAEQIKIPDSMVQLILEFMQEAHDLSHPLAYKLMTRLQSSPNAEQNEFLQQQHEKRKKLLQKLSASSQELFDNFRSLTDEADQLVTSIDPLTVPNGKIGMEIECVVRRMDVYADYDEFWEMGLDAMNNQEVRRKEDYLEFGAPYMLSLSEVADQLRDWVKFFAGFHIHLDKKVHPRKPILNNMFIPGEDFYVEANELGTWEVRGLFVPTDRTVKRLSPALMADAVATHIYAADSAENNDTDGPDGLEIPSSTGLTERKILWGALCNANTNPKVRLGLLKMVQHPYFLQAYNMKAVLWKYKAKHAELLVDTMKKSKALSHRHLRALVEYAAVNGVTGYVEQQIESTHYNVASFAVAKFLEAKKSFTEEEKENTLKIYENTKHSEVKQTLIEFWLRDKTGFDAQLVKVCAGAPPEVQVEIIKSWCNNAVLFKQQLIPYFASTDFDIVKVLLNRLAHNAEDFADQLRQVVQEKPGYLRSQVVEIWFTDPEFFKEDLLSALFNNTFPSEFFISVLHLYFGNLGLFKDDLIRRYHSDETSPSLKNMILKRMIKFPGQFATELESVEWDTLELNVKNAFLVDLWLQYPSKYGKKIYDAALDMSSAEFSTKAVEILIKHFFLIFKEESNPKVILLKLYKELPFEQSARVIFDLWEKEPDFFEEELKEFKGKYMSRKGDLAKLERMTYEMQMRNLR